MPILKCELSFLCSAPKWSSFTACMVIRPKVFAACNTGLWRFTYLVFMFVLISSSVFAEAVLEPVRLFSKDSYLLSTRMQVLEDKTNRLTIDQVASSQFEPSFKSNDQPILNIGISKSTYWLKVSLIYPDAYPNKEEQKQWYLEVGSSQVDKANLYISEYDGVYRVQSSDVRTTYSDRPITHVNSIFPINLTLGQELTLYLKIKKSTSLRIPLVLWTPEGFVRKAGVEEFFYGLFYGGMLILLVYNLFLYVSIRDISYLYYVFYLGNVTIFEMLEMGHGLVHFENVFFVVNREYIVFFIWWMTISAVLFAKSFMHLKATYPELDFSVNIFLAVAVASVLVASFHEVSIAIEWTRIINSIFMTIYIGIVFYVWMKGNVNAKYFFIAWAFNILGFMVFSGVTSTTLPATPLTLAATPMGILLESLFFSFALANRIKSEQSLVIAADEKDMKYMEQYQSAFNHALVGMYKMEVSGRVVSVNPAMADMLGFDDANGLLLHDMSIFNVVFDGGRQQLFEVLEKGGITNNLCFRRCDGKTVWVAHSARTIVDISGKIMHLEGILEDITQTKLKDLAVRGKEKEIARKTIAEASTHAKSEFLANMNHEIRTPLAAIIGFSESLKDENISARDKENAIELVVDSSNILLQLINDILDFSKIEAGKLDVEKIPVNICSVVNDLRDEFEGKAKHKNLSLDVVYRYPIPSDVLSDPTRIYQILSNLCANAIKFTDIGSVVVVVSWDEDINKLKFEVIDSGQGLEKEVREKLFQVFDQADTSSTRQHGGAGLGLAISKRLANIMGGDIEVLSKSGTGSVFTFTVAAKFPPNMMWIRTNDLSAPVHVNQATQIPQLRGVVLLAEDNIVNQKLIEKVLKKTGVDVVVVSDGVKVCDYCDESLPDFLLMDINMPNRNGLEATKYLRRKGYKIPIYALTAETAKGEIDKALDAGCDGFLSKPIDRALLFSALAENILHKHPNERLP